MGRPKGSKNKPKGTVTVIAVPEVKKRRTALVKEREKSRALKETMTYARYADKKWVVVKMSPENTYALLTWGRGKGMISQWVSTAVITIEEI